ncbi:RagB/SusD family nutrient uptake outer membrane protein [Bacteroides sp. 224]|uniref:RagB/SusD family nutrient uptake outer membrane protein n=1 Tax=Bacteroides sp. 224 TaxID=2302936 RepID=UPI0013D30DDB|nr:RagB/SusD family nutrient uptake outer membrane protein [Bacteroides sp. 224]NDV64982.1 RagB/SusD family nutrient uptake outer membrane protein [Bacteroides sp. 224]
MKKIILSLLISLAFASCQDWLEITPYDRLEKEKIFPNEVTTNEALNGLYVSLASNNLYGLNMSCGMLEVMAQHYVVPTEVAYEYYYLNRFDYTADNSKTLFANSFKDAYKLIAGCNDFLSTIKQGQDQYETEKFNIYYGEALAIRTLVHFDMLRLFGPMDAEKERSSVPYYTESTDNPKPILTGAAMVDSLLVDIDQAINFLKNDPIIQDGKKSNSANDKVAFFKTYRNYRMNYYAAYLLKARLCLYKGDESSKATAYNIASTMLNNMVPGNTSKETKFTEEFPLVKQKGTEIITDYVFFDELIFAIHNTNRNDVYKKYFSADLDALKILGGGQKAYDYLYGAASPGGLDPGLRSRMWSFDGVKNHYLFNRLAVQTATTSNPYISERQSMMRVGELYLIAAETAPTTEEKREWIDKLRSGKGYDPGNAADLADVELNALIDLEFEKETFGEGQYFFYAKRKDLKLHDSNNTSVNMDRGKFVPPLPEVETDYRDRE